MTELVELVTSGTALAGFGLALLVFGFAPGFLLRLILELYPRDDPRRRELVAELRAVPRLWRLMWVAEQLECGLSEGLAARRRGRARRRNATNVYIDENVLQAVLDRNERFPSQNAADEFGQFDNNELVKVEIEDLLRRRRRRRWRGTRRSRPWRRTG